MAYDQISSIIFIVETRLEPPYFYIYTILVHDPLHTRGSQSIYWGITTLNDGLRVAFPTKSLQHWLRERRFDERIEFRRTDRDEHAHIVL